MDVRIVAGEHRPRPPRNWQERPADRTERQRQVASGSIIAATPWAMETPAGLECSDALAERHIAGAGDVADLSPRRTGSCQHRNEPKRWRQRRNEIGWQPVRKACGLNVFGRRGEGRLPARPPYRASMRGRRDIAHYADQPGVEVAISQSARADGDD